MVWVMAVKQITLRFIHASCFMCPQQKQHGLANTGTQMDTHTNTEQREKEKRGCLSPFSLLPSPFSFLPLVHFISISMALFFFLYSFLIVSCLYLPVLARTSGSCTRRTHKIVLLFAMFNCSTEWPNILPFSVPLRASLGVRISLVYFAAVRFVNRFWIEEKYKAARESGRKRKRVSPMYNC